MKTTMMINIGVIMLIAMFFCTVVPAESSDIDTMRNRAWVRQKEGINDLFQCLKNGSDNKRYEAPMFKIVSAEVNLLAYGVSPNNPNLFCRLAEGAGNQTDPTAFAYRILREKFRQKCGFEPDPIETFKNLKFRGISSTVAQFSGTIEITFDY